MKVIELQYLPQPIYFAILLKESQLKIDLYEHYVKQSFRNRCHILSGNGVHSLSVPVIGGNKKTIAKDIQIDYSQKWLNRHWRAIQSAYGKAPFFEFYADELRIIYDKKHKFLHELSLHLLTQCLDFLNIAIEINLSTSYVALDECPDNDFRSKINPKNNPLFYKSYKQIAYQQVFGSKFVNNLSIIDLIFCEGPNAGKILKSGIDSGTQ